MAKEREYKTHPLVEKLQTASGGHGAVRLLGYFGGSAGEGMVRVHPSLGDLSVYDEIREADILLVEEASPEELPHGGSVIWVQGDAEVRRCVLSRARVEARFLAGGIATRMAGGPALPYAGAPARAALEPETAANCGFSVWPCSVIWGACMATASPCAPTQQWLCQLESFAPTCGGFTCNYLCPTRDCPPTAVYTCSPQCGPITRDCPVASFICRR